MKTNKPSTTKKPLELGWKRATILDAVEYGRLENNEFTEAGQHDNLPQETVSAVILQLTVLPESYPFEIKAQIWGWLEKKDKKSSLWKIENVYCSAKIEPTVEEDNMFEYNYKDLVNKDIDVYLYKSEKGYITVFDLIPSAENSKPWVEEQFDKAVESGRIILFSNANAVSEEETTPF